MAELFNNDSSLNEANRRLNAQGNPAVTTVTPGTVSAGFIAPERQLTDDEILENIQPTAKAGNRIYNRSELAIIKFPLDIERSVPYILFKIFETQQGAVDVTDETSQSLRGGVDVATAAAAGIPGATTILGAVAGAQLAPGALGTLGGAALTTDVGLDAVDTFANTVLGGIGGGITSRAKDILKSFALKRNNSQLALAIALFMPEGITTNYDNEYETLSVTATTGGLGFAAQALSRRDGVVKDVNPYIAEASAAIAGKIVGNDDFARLGLFATTGLVVNPQLETIYSTPVLRKFTFDFRLVPRNATEAQAIQGIIKNLKFFSAPEIKDGTGGRFLVPPAQFEIEFYDGDNNTNQYFFKTKKCVLTGISLDYTPNGFATFKDGAPVETRMQLTFQETVIIDRKAVVEGY